MYNPHKYNIKKINNRVIKHVFKLFVSEGSIYKKLIFLKKKRLYKNKIENQKFNIISPLKSLFSL